MPFKERFPPPAARFPKKTAFPLREAGSALEKRAGISWPMGWGFWATLGCMRCIRAVSGSREIYEQLYVDARNQTDIQIQSIT